MTKVTHTHTHTKTQDCCSRVLYFLSLLSSLLFYLKGFKVLIVQNNVQSSKCGEIQAKSRISSSIGQLLGWQVFTTADENTHEQACS